MSVNFPPAEIGDECYVNRGCARLRLRDLEAALVDFNTALRLNPKCAEAYYNRGALWAAKRELGKALDDMNAAAKLDKQPAFYLARAAIWSEKGQVEDAIADWGEAIRLDPKTVAFAYRGNAWLEKKEYEKAIADLSAAVRLDASDAFSFQQRGLAISGSIAEAFTPGFHQAKQFILQSPRTAVAIIKSFLAQGVRKCR